MTNEIQADSSHCGRWDEPKGLIRLLTSTSAFWASMEASILESFSRRRRYQNVCIAESGHVMRVSTYSTQTLAMSLIAPPREGGACNATHSFRSLEEQLGGCSSCSFHKTCLLHWQDFEQEFERSGSCRSPQQHSIGIEEVLLPGTMGGAIRTQYTQNIASNEGTRGGSVVSTSSLRRRIHRGLNKWWAFSSTWRSTWALNQEALNSHTLQKRQDLP